MVGYLVLVPADRQPPFLREAVPPVVTPAAWDVSLDGSLQDGPARNGSAGSDGAPGEEAAGAELIRVDVARRTAEVAGQPLDLTYLEFELLAHLVAHPHRVHTRDQLVATVWGYGHIGDGRTVDVHVARLRRKLGEHRKAIATVRRVGYKYTPPLAD
jgi:DNA-binding response OmpR family regulator